MANLILLLIAFAVVYIGSREITLAGVEIERLKPKDRK